jgi:hypothetical protein
MNTRSLPDLASGNARPPVDSRSTRARGARSLGASPVALVAVLLLLSVVGVWGAARTQIGPAAGVVLAPTSTLASTHTSLSPQPRSIPTGAGAGYNVSFPETGLPNDTSWSIWLTPSLLDYCTSNQTYQSNGTGNGTGCTPDAAYFTMPNGTYPFTIRPPGLYTADPSSGNVTVNGANVTVPVVFRIEYNVTFVASGIPNGTPWGLEFEGALYSVTNSIGFWVGNGTYPYNVGAPGTVAPCSPVFPYGNVTVDGANVTVPVPFTCQPVYEVAFTETGLANGTPWQLWLGEAHSAAQRLPRGASESSARGSVAAWSATQFFNLTNASYLFVPTANGYATPNAPGNFTVNGSGTNVSVTFVLAPYTISFAEAGLPSGTVFQVDLGGPYPLDRSGVSTVPFQVPDGTYPFSVPGATGYSSTPSSGNVTVAGANASIALTFVPGGSGTAYAVTFAETGLPAGTSWAVDLNGTIVSSSGSSIIFAEPNGTYPYGIGQVGEYVANPGSGQVAVDGSPVTVTVAFNLTSSTPGQYPITFSEAGLPGGTNWSVSLSGASNETGRSTTPTIELWEESGTYQVTIPAVAGESANSTTEVTIAGSPAFVNVTFTPTRYVVSILETGLPSGASWSVKLYNASGGVPAAATTSGVEMEFRLPDGSYNVDVTGPTGYRVTLSQSVVTVAGASPAAVTAAFAAIPSSAESTAALPLGSIGIVLGVTLAGGLAVGWAGRRYAVSRWKSDANRWVQEIHQVDDAPPNRPPR